MLSYFCYLLSLFSPAYIVLKGFSFCCIMSSLSYRVSVMDWACSCLFMSCFEALLSVISCFCYLLSLILFAYGVFEGLYFCNRVLVVCYLWNLPNIVFRSSSFLFSRLFCILLNLVFLLCMHTWQLPNLLSCLCICITGEVALKYCCVWTLKTYLSPIFVLLLIGRNFFFL